MDVNKQWCDHFPLCELHLCRLLTVIWSCSPYRIDRVCFYRCHHNLLCVGKLIRMLLTGFMKRSGYVSYTQFERVTCHQCSALRMSVMWSLMFVGGGTVPKGGMPHADLQQDSPVPHIRQIGRKSLCEWLSSNLEIYTDTMPPALSGGFAWSLSVTCFRRLLVCYCLLVMNIGDVRCWWISSTSSLFQSALQPNVNAR